MMETYNHIISYIDELVQFLKSHGVEAEFNSHLENDYLLAHEFYEKYKKNPAARLDEKGRAALGGLYELYKWIWSVKDCEEFYKLKEHLKLLIEASPKINAISPMISPVTKKQDDKTNKFVEAIVGMFAAKVGYNLDLDDPVKSSNGTNPDVLFDYDGNRVAFACKTLRGDSPETILFNLKSAVKQINRADCNAGYIVINAMNILAHDKIRNTIYSEHLEPLSILWDDVNSKYIHLRANDEQEIFNLFGGNKVRPIILTFVHSVTRILSPLGNLSTSLKATYATNFEIPGADIQRDLDLLTGVNEFIHNRL
ncbi:MAG: hypothetical protein GY941_17585 [Planctomycetes bacterium]|nr:hypothetical protein [Planctomycetota bacterium]